MLQTNILLKLSEIRNTSRSIAPLSTTAPILCWQWGYAKAPLSSIVSIDRTSIILASRRGSRKSTSIASEIGTESRPKTRKIRTSFSDRFIDPESKKHLYRAPLSSTIRESKHLYRRLIPTDFNRRIRARLYWVLRGFHSQCRHTNLARVPFPFKGYIPIRYQASGSIPRAFFFNYVPSISSGKKQVPW